MAIRIARIVLAVVTFVAAISLSQGAAQAGATLTVTRGAAAVSTTFRRRLRG